MIAEPMISEVTMYRVTIKGRTEILSAAELVRLQTELSAHQVHVSSCERIINRICVHYGLTRSQLMGDSKEYRVAFPRMVAMYLMRHYTPERLSSVAGMFNKKDIGTVTHACRRVREQAETDPATKADVETIMQNIFQPKRQPTAQK
jgi:chromosomal replication initiator protein